MASYALLTHLIAQVCGLEVDKFIHTFGDVHIYNNHHDQVSKQLKRAPYDLPELYINPDVREIDEFTIDDFHISGYKSHSSIKAVVAV